MTLPIIKKSFKKFQPSSVNYRSYKKNSNKTFRECLFEKVSKEVFINNDDRLKMFCNINLEVLNQHAPQKKKYV